MSTVLVTDGEQRAALAAVRSLGRAGHRVLVASADPRPLAGASRWATRSLPVPEPLGDPEGFSRAIAGIVLSLGVEVVLPMTEAAHLALLPGRGALHPAVVAAPSFETFVRTADKQLVISTAASLGIAAPRQVTMTTRPAPGPIDIGGLTYPLVVKPSRSIGEAGGRREKLGVRHAEDPARLAGILADLPAAGFPVLIQERIIGPGVGVFVLRWNGRSIARFAHRRIREKPPSGGVSVLAESVPGDPELFAATDALLAALDWEGVAMVEFKRDASTGRPYLMEINGRFWGSLQLALDAGVDFPRLLVEAALGRVPPESLTWRSGVRSRWFWGDLDHLLLRMLRSSAALDLPAGAPGRLGALAGFLGWQPWRERDAVFRLNDPMPFFRETAAWIRAL